MTKTKKKAGKKEGVVEKALNRTLELGVKGLVAEFRELSKYTAPNMTMKAFLANHDMGRNRYMDVPCQDQNRVIIKWQGLESDYIHANYVGTPWSEKRFICAQGPLERTTNEFWAMVIQEEVYNLVMLCNLVEQGKNKCFAYWPAKVDQSMKFDAVGIEIRNLGSEPMSPDDPEVVVTRIKINWTNGEREIRHFQWTNWPDRGVPPVKFTSMELLKRIRASKTPILVHCSAGIGRTGTIVAIEYILERLANGMDVVAMNELLKKLRSQRAYSIQNEFQYLYVHRILVAYFTERNKDKNPIFQDPEYQEKLKTFRDEYEEATDV